MLQRVNADRIMPENLYLILIRPVLEKTAQKLNHFFVVDAISKSTDWPVRTVHAPEKCMEIKANFRQKLRAFVHLLFKGSKRQNDEKIVLRGNKNLI